MRLGLSLGYWSGEDVAANLTLAQEADRLGYDVMWAAEAFGADTPTVLAWLGSRTKRIGLGAGVMQIPARTPAATAMTAATLDLLSHGRFRLGLGVSGPQVSEGWHGVAFDAPLARTREYVEIVRQVLRRETLTYSGRHWALPLPGGQGKALRLSLRPLRETVPVYLAAVGPANVQLCGEIADGWLAAFFSPEHAAVSLDPLAQGMRRRVTAPGGGPGDTSPLAGGPGDPTPIDGGGRDLTTMKGGRREGLRTLRGFDIVATVPVSLDDDLDRAAAPLRAHCALYVGGMGSREQNFYHRLAVRMGYAAAAQQIQEHYLAGRHRQAAAAVPRAFIDETALIGSRSRVRERLHRYADAGVTTLTVSPTAPSFDGRIAVLRTMTELIGETGLAD